MQIDRNSRIGVQFLLPLIIVGNLAKLTKEIVEASVKWEVILVTESKMPFPY